MAVPVAVLFAVCVIASNTPNGVNWDRAFRLFFWMCLGLGVIVTLYILAFGLSFDVL